MVNRILSVRKQAFLLINLQDLLTKRLKINTMKKFLSFCLFSFLAFTVSAQTSHVKVGLDATYFEEQYDNAFWGPTIAVETSIKNRFALSLQVGYGALNENRKIGEKLIIKAFTFNPEFRFYPKGDLNGFYFGGGFSYTGFSAVLKQNDERLSYPLPSDNKDAFALRGAIGYQARLNEKLTLNTDLHLGGAEGAVIGLGVGIGYKI